MIAVNESTFNEAPPINAPSMSFSAKQSAILSTRALSDTITTSYILFDANLY